MDWLLETPVGIAVSGYGENNGKTFGEEFTADRQHDVAERGPGVGAEGFEFLEKPRGHERRLAAQHRGRRADNDRGPAPANLATIRSSAMPLTPVSQPSSSTSGKVGFAWG